MEKATLPKEVAEAIRTLKSWNYTNADIVRKVFEVKKDNDQVMCLRDFASDNFDTFLSSLVNGYEVEQTPEDKVREWFAKHQQVIDTTLNNDTVTKTISRINGAEEVLNLLGIKIEGVNA